MKRLSLSIFAVLTVMATLVFTGGCQVKNESRSCTYNGQAIDCAEFDRLNAPAPEKPKDDVGHGQASGFDCGTAQCRSGDQYCLQSVTASNVVVESQCATRPFGATCASLKSDALRHFATAVKDCQCGSPSGGPARVTCEAD